MITLVKAVVEIVFDILLTLYNHLVSVAHCLNLPNKCRLCLNISVILTFKKNVVLVMVTQ